MLTRQQVRRAERKARKEVGADADGVVTYVIGLVGQSHEAAEVVGCVCPNASDVINRVMQVARTEAAQRGMELEDVWFDGRRIFPSRN